MKWILTMLLVLAATPALSTELVFEVGNIIVDAGPNITGEYGGRAFGAMLSAADDDFPDDLHAEGMMNCANDIILMGSTMENIAADQSEFFGYAQFTVDTPMIYTISGSFNRTIPTCDVGEQPEGSFSLSTYLYERTDPNNATELFRNDQNGGRGVGDVCDLTYTIGEEGGSASNVLTGDITGTLVPGEVYGFYVRQNMGEYDSAFHDNQTGSGSVELKLTPVPEPSLALSMISASGFLAWLMQRNVG